MAESVLTVTLNKILMRIGLHRMIAHFSMASKHCDALLSMFEPHVTFAPLHLFFHLPTVWGRGTEERSPPLDLIVFGPLKPCCAPAARCGLLLFNIYTVPGVNLQNKMGKTLFYFFFYAITPAPFLFSQSPKRGWKPQKLMMNWMGHHISGDAPTEVKMINRTGKWSTYKKTHRKS